MKGQEALLEAMRRDLRKVAPVLVREGWTQEEVAEISTTVRAHIASGNEEGLVAMAKWLSDRAWQILVVEMDEYDRQRASEYRVGHDEDALRRMNREWAKTRGRAKG